MAIIFSHEELNIVVKTKNISLGSKWLQWLLCKIGLGTLDLDLSKDGLKLFSIIACVILFRIRLSASSRDMKSIDEFPSCPNEKTKVLVIKAQILTWMWCQINKFNYSIKIHHQLTKLRSMTSQVYTCK